jgi:molybdenum cofactor synthesis domain-containing protein
MEIHMKKINVEDAVGLPLCHDITAMRDGFKGAAFRRGHVITKDDIPVLLDLGKKQVFIWEDNAGEIHEEDAALRLAKMTAIEGAHFTGPSEGKMQLIADHDGMFRVNTALLERINSIPDITITTIPDHFPVKKGMRLASMRIVPLVTKEARIMEAERLCIEKKLLDLKPFHCLKVGCIVTGSEVYSGRIKDKFGPVVKEKMSHYPAEILGITICDDDVSMIIGAAKGFINQGADLLLFTGGMSVDPDDVTPSAIRSLGADVVTHGVPSQPGNMTLVAYLGKTAILGVPGAAISLPTTIFDVLLPQIFAGVPFTREELIRLGDGGLCLQCPECHFPVCTFGRY